MSSPKLPGINSLNFVERLGLLVDRELTEHDDERLSSRLHQAQPKQNAYRIVVKGESLRRKTTEEEAAS